MPGETHFLGSILSTASTSHDDDAHLVLIDGQQRITTLMLLVAALHHTLRGDDPATAAELERVLVRTDDATRTKLRPHRAWADVFESVVLGDRSPADDAARIAVRRQLRVLPQSDPPGRGRAHLARGAEVSSTSRSRSASEANAQQIFESLNSTGEPLRDHELIHNYVLMGLSHAEQSEIEEEFWLPIERNTGERSGASGVTTS